MNTKFDHDTFKQQHFRGEDRLYHVLPNLAVRDEPQIWREVVGLLISRGLTRDEALRRIRFAYTGLLDGDLPPGVS